MARKRGMQYIPYDYEAAYNKAMEYWLQCLRQSEQKFFVEML